MINMAAAERLKSLATLKKGKTDRAQSIELRTLSSGRKNYDRMD